MGTRSRCHNWPVASVSPEDAIPYQSQMPRVQKKIHHLKEKLEFKVFSPKILPNGGRDAGTVSASKNMVNTMIYTSLPH